ncbi:MAG: alpha-N-arabinofuranosidase [Candidatus Brocadiia bacterium]|nr:MAG: alpha-N-arabinofuranosidase [Candidatus Brocadiia bacterium]
MILLWVLAVLFIAGASLAEEKKSASLIVQAGKGTEQISRNIYGHFAEHLGRCFYDGIWVGPDSPIPNTRGIRNDIVAALRDIKTPVLRWPGGCFADTYHWKDGVGPREKRKPILNVFWGEVYEDNSFGTHEFMDLCEQIGCEAYIAGNLGSGTVEEMQDWIQYITFDGKSPMSDLRRANGREKPWKLAYFGIGNENWGCGGTMNPKFYADLYRRYKTYIRNYSGNKLFVVACGANGKDYNWTEVIMQESVESPQNLQELKMNGLSLHYYCGSGKRKKLAAEFDMEDWFVQLKRAIFMDELLDKHIAIMDKYDPSKDVVLLVDEWGTWHKEEPGTNRSFLYQQNTLHDALVAGITLNIFNQRCSRVKMANIAQTVNVLQAMILTEGKKMILTPSYYVFKMYTVHHDATLLPIELKCDDYTFGQEKIPSVNVSASKDSSGKIHITLCNLDPQNPVTLNCQLQDVTAKKVTGQILTHDDINAHNTFDKPDVVKIQPYNNASIKDNKLSMALPPKSVIALEIE